MYELVENCVKEVFDRLNSIRILVLGDPCSGKSTLANYFAREKDDKKYSLPPGPIDLSHNCKTLMFDGER